MPSTTLQFDSTDIAKRIRLLRGRRVVLDMDLADLYGVTPERLIEVVQRNRPRFSVDFAFSLELDEIRDLESPVAILAFTEHGVIIAASSLNSPRAVEMSIHVVRVFVKLRETLPSDTVLGRKIEVLEQSSATLDAKTREQFEEVYRAIHKLSAPPAPNMRSDRELH